MLINVKGVVDCTRENDIGCVVLCACVGRIVSLGILACVWCVCVWWRGRVCVCVDSSRSGRASFLWSDDTENLLTLLLPLKQQLLLLQCERLGGTGRKRGRDKERGKGRYYIFHFWYKIIHSVEWNHKLFEATVSNWWGFQRKGTPAYTLKPEISPINTEAYAKSTRGWFLYPLVLVLASS